MLNNIDSDKHFSYVRFQDGELIALIGYDWITDIEAIENKVGNIDGHLYFDEMCTALRESICSDKNVIYSNKNKYVFRISCEDQIFIINKCPSYSDKFWKNKKKSKNDILKMLNDLASNIKVKISGDILNTNIYQSPHIFIKFVDIVNKKNIVFIGPEYCKNLTFLNIKKHIIIPRTNCFLEKDNIMKEIICTMQEYEKKNQGCIFLFAASMTTNYIIDKLFERSLDKHTMIDVGSAFDNFLSKESFNQIKRRVYNPVFIKNNYPQNFWIN